MPTNLDSLNSLAGTPEASECDEDKQRETLRLDLERQAEDDRARWEAFERVAGPIEPGTPGNTTPCHKRAAKCLQDAERFRAETHAWRQSLKQQKWW